MDTTLVPGVYEIDLTFSSGNLDWTLPYQVTMPDRCSDAYITIETSCDLAISHTVQRGNPFQFSSQPDGCSITYTPSNCDASLIGLTPQTEAPGWFYHDDQVTLLDLNADWDLGANYYILVPLEADYSIAYLRIVFRFGGLSVT